MFLRHMASIMTWLDLNYIITALQSTNQPINQSIHPCLSKSKISNKEIVAPKENIPITPPYGETHQDRLYTECPNATHEFLGTSVRERKIEAQDTKEHLAVVKNQGGLMMV